MCLGDAGLYRSIAEVSTLTSTSGTTNHGPVGLTSSHDGGYIPGSQIRRNKPPVAREPLLRLSAHRSIHRLSLPKVGSVARARTGSHPKHIRSIGNSRAAHSPLCRRRTESSRRVLFRDSVPRIAVCDPPPPPFPFCFASAYLTPKACMRGACVCCIYSTLHGEPLTQTLPETSPTTHTA